MTEPGPAGTLDQAAPAAGDPEVLIERLAAGGDGVGHLEDGMTVFVSRAAPGDRVVLGAVRRRKRHAHAEIASVVSAGPDRVTPPCPHFTRDRCGGCQWQHLAPAAQAVAKRRIVGDALRRIGGLDVPDPELVPSPRPSGYRTTVTLTVRRAGRDVIAGFHDAADSDRVFPLDRCLIARDELNALWRAIGPATGALPRGDDVRLKLRITPDGGLHVIVNGGDGGWTTPEPLARAAAAAGLAATVWWQPTGGAVRVMAGPPVDSGGGAVAFAQVNAEVAALLREAVVAAASPPDDAPAPWRVLDLYAGAGETALPLAERGCDVVMVEMDRRAVRHAEQRAKSSGVRLRAIAARVEDQLAALFPADAVIVNPPRTGLAETVAAQLAAARPTRLVYVSCDPATLARDLKRIGVTREAMITLRAFDMFPQTSHVETLLVAHR